ncbi:MAG TPA: TonB-dependent receptor [Bryobacterales bacterium]|nr:TonB-dependent receptor [Bryobacterales bacterium]
MTHYQKVLFVFLAAPLLALAQSFTASVRGVVTDASQAAVPNAKVTITEVDRNAQRETVTDTSGRYVITALPPGRYTLSAEASGFSRYTRSAFALQVQQDATINVELSVGAVATAVTVEAGAPLLNTTIATLGQVVENRYILSLPLAGRAPLALVALSPGLTPSNLNPGGQSNTNFVANGTRNSTADVLLDGMSVTDVEQNSGITNLEYQPSVDVVEEFKVQTNFFSAEFGNSGGSVVNVVTKSGANEVHGDAYEFHRNSALNANNWFSNRAGRSIPDFRRNVFGGTVGGPVWIPNVYNGHNKTFFFYDYEGSRQTNATTRNVSVPTLLERQGNFTDTRASNGRLITIYNPFDTYQTATGSTLRRAFAGNVVPQSMFRPIAVKALASYPQPTSDGNAFTHTNNFFGQGVNQSDSDQMDIKIDHNISDKQRIMSRYSLNFGSSIPAVLWGSLADPFSNGDSTSRTQNFVFDYTRTHSPTTLITLRYGVLRQHAQTIPKSDGFDPTSLGLPALYLTSGLKQYPTFSPEGYQETGQVGYGRIGRGDDVNSITGSVTKIFGGHSLKTGAEARLMRLNYLQPGYPQGHFTFNRATTSEDPNRGDSFQGNAIASMLIGWPNGGDYHLDPWSASASQYYGFYAQDDWKLTRRLTVNLGLRYDFDVPRTERYNRYSWFDFYAPSPIAGSVPASACPACGDLLGQFKFVDNNDRHPMDGDYHNVQPRVGLAYALDNKTSIRAGYGIFYTLSRATVKGHTGSGFTTNTSVQSSRDGGLTQYASLDNPYPDGLNIPPGRAEGALTFLGMGIGTESRPNQNPQYQQWNFSIQRQLPGNSVLQVNYTGGKGTHLYFGGGVTNMNLLDPSYWTLGRTKLNALVPNPFYGIITNPLSPLSAPTVTYNTLLHPYPQYSGGVSGSERNLANSIYHGVQIQFEKRFSHGLAFLGHYTVSKLIDDSSFSDGNVGWLGGVTDVQDPLNLRLERAVSAMDIPQRLVLTFSYQLPIGKGKWLGSNWGRGLNMLLGGWEANGLLTFSSGFPLNSGSQFRESPLQGAVLWNGVQRPNLIGDPRMPGSVEDRLNNYLNEAAFSRPAPDTLGTAPRTLPNYRSPGIRNGDVAVFKNVSFTESRYIQLRLEAFNITNTPTFATPHMTYGASNFGVIDNYAGGRGPRELQVAIKFYF